jgi:DNA polymerase III delta' subunit
VATASDPLTEPVFRARAHARALEPIRRAIVTERPPHALMLVGPRGVGKTTLALDLAAGLLCLAEDPAGRPCRACRACRKVDHGTHPDVHRLAPIGAGGQVRLVQVHELQAALSFLPFEGRYRLAIIEGAERMNPDAQNAFLKTLEEPPARVCIVLAVEDESLLLPTVGSRCARLVLAPLARPEIASLVVGRGVSDPGRAAAIARVAGGRPGRALALARDPEAVLVRDRLLRTLLDLARADRHTRLAAVPGLLTDGTAIADALEWGTGAGELDGFGIAPDREREPEAEIHGAAANGADANRADADGRDSETGADRAKTRIRANTRARSRPPAPAERRRAVLAVIDAWRQLARDVAIAARGGRSELVQVDLLEEIVALGSDLAPGRLDEFLRRLDELDAAVEAYANPELALDVLLIRWPRPGESTPGVSR